MAAASNYSYETLRVSFAAPFVLHVELNRPTNLNAFSPQFWQDCKNCFEKLADDPDVRAVVLSGGDSRIFTAGLDSGLKETRRQRVEREPSCSFFPFQTSIYMVSSHLTHLLANFSQGLPTRLG